MFWIVLFIIVVGLIIEGAKPSGRNEKTKSSEGKQAPQSVSSDHIKKKTAEKLKVVQERQEFLENRKEAQKIERLNSDLGIEEWKSDTDKDEMLTLGIKNSDNTFENKSTKLKTELKVAQKPPSPLVLEFEHWGINSLWHMTHIRNVHSIVQTGLLQHSSLRLSARNPVDISDPNVQRWRTKVDPHYGLSLHDYVPLYINPRNPMLYVQKEIQSEICFIEVSLEALRNRNFLISDGNAASPRTQFFKVTSALKLLPWNVLKSKFWTDFEDGKRMACSEVLIPGSIEPRCIKAVHCFSSTQSGILAKKGISSVISMDKYFR